MKRTKAQWIKLLQGQIYSLEHNYLNVEQSENAIKVLLGVDD